ncbi:hypothetical protein B0H17DRAFT_1214288 [Mycena rosella]|uniref:MACPF domain-containing protein n=1 Tax=Mycena rosella TaxID=1033263 RepID=A0AAD7CND2_MYCRO|nr:hypothetical protein B0H17DRAFT_1214288 [Mycena rosella]
MPEDLAIVIIMGLRSPGKTLAKAISRADAGGSGDLSRQSDCIPTTRRIHVVECYYPAGSGHRVFFPKSQQRATLPEIEKAVEQQLKKIGARFSDVARIVFVHSNRPGDSTGFPFENHTRFLEFQGRTLFQKLLVVQSSAETPPQLEWDDLVKAGMRVTFFDGTHDSARSTVRQLFSEPAPTISQPPDPPMEHTIPSASTVTLAGNRQCDDSAAPQDNPNRTAYIGEAFATGRHPDEAVIVLVGRSGHGKSKTVNRLLGQNLLQVGKSTSGSTTKDIQRVAIPVYNSDTEVTVTLAFDDTPGAADTIHSDRATNSSLLRIYKERCFPAATISHGSSPEVRHQTYPNIILLVASWDSITEDAHNEPQHFTSAAGKSMHTLSLSGLVDHDRPNVVVVVTKSLSFWNEFDDFQSAAEKNTHWNIEAGRRRGIISDLQKKAFPKLAPWPTVFVENGGGTNMHTKFPILPNGELSHQNLFEAIRSVIEHSGPRGGSDLAGMHVLDVLTGAEPLNLASPETKILVNKSEAIIDSEGKPTNNPLPPPLPSPRNHSHRYPSQERRIQELADSYLGVMYDPLSGTFGRTCVLSLDRSAIKFSEGPDTQREAFTHVSDAQHEKIRAASRLRCDFEMPDIAGLNTHYSSSNAFQSALSNESQLYIAQHVTALVTAVALCPQLSEEMLSLVSRLPRWTSSDLESKQKYQEFFSNHGTHVMLRLALGGNLRVVVHDLQDVNDHDRGGEFSFEGTAPTLNGIGINVGGYAGHSRDSGAGNSKGRRNIIIFRDGGGSIASELTSILETHFKQASSHPVQSSWPRPEVRAKWVKALEDDPTLLPDNDYTEYRWLHTLGGLSKNQESDLRQAAEFYLKMRQKEKSPAGPPPSADSSGVSNDLPRSSNFQRVRQGFKNLFAGKSKGRRGGGS